MKRITLFLDFDGVINPDVESKDFTDWGSFDYVEPAAWGSSQKYAILFSLTMVQMLMALPVDIVWLTDWRQKIRFVEARCGFTTPLPVMDGPGTGLGMMPKMWWKRIIVEAHDGPFIWIDDNLRMQGLDWSKRKHTVAFALKKKVPHLALSLNSPAGYSGGNFEKNKGLRLSDFRLIEAFIESVKEAQP